CARWILYGDYW
nr:immunoglobulin heavy chain junction region [Mus musculus]MBK4185721.1 immunoglobulin heavy chain junction region [Mus musculus]MBK4185722.1 immunoglobulin heavy chain junction region [Mus musculus]